MIITPRQGVSTAPAMRVSVRAPGARSLARESSTARFYNLAPWIAPQAYLHIVFKPADMAALDEVCELIELPQSWLDILAVQNGAFLFSNAISIYGVRSSRALLNRTDVFETEPFSLVDENRSRPVDTTGRFVTIGSYSYDGTRSVLDRQDGSVLAIPRRSERTICHWPDHNAWINEELERLSLLFDHEGKMRISREHTIPTWPSA